MNPYFVKLGQTVLERWQQQNFSLQVFPDLACTALSEAPPSDEVDMQELIHDFLASDEQPFQSESGFGQPELIAYNDPRFYIQILFWLDGTTEIHQHEFSGAFHVMQGSSMHSEFGFENARSVTPHICVGDLHVKNIELLEMGSTVPIFSGKKCIHSLFHLDTPSVTVVIRTHHDPGTGPQYNYLPPHVAVNPLHSDPLTARRKQLLDVWETLKDANYTTLLKEMIKRLDFERGFSILRHTMTHLNEIGNWDEVLDIFQTKHGELAAGVKETLKEAMRRESISQMRNYVVDPEHRFFLALLMNVQSSSDLLALVSQRFPGSSPIDMILTWIEELMECNDSGITLLDASFPESDDPMAQWERVIATLKNIFEGNIHKETASAEILEIQATLSNSCLRFLLAR